MKETRRSLFRRLLGLAVAVPIAAAIKPTLKPNPLAVAVTHTTGSAVPQIMCKIRGHKAWYANTANGSPNSWTFTQCEIPPVRYLTEAEMAEMDCPFPPETDWA